MTEYLLHNRVRLALHKLKDGNGTPLLLLHGLGERSPHNLPREYAEWPSAAMNLLSLEKMHFSDALHDYAVLATQASA